MQNNTFLCPKNIEFLLSEVFDMGPIYKGYRITPEIFSACLDATNQLARQIAPYAKEMDTSAPVFINGQVLVHPQLKTLIRHIGEGGWIGATLDKKHNGHELPGILNDTCWLHFYAANVNSFSAGLTRGAAELLAAFAPQEISAAILPYLLDGTWQGTMAITEPEVGSSVSDIATIATPVKENLFHISGQKVFISAGDHDAVENIVHIVLARTKGAPPGSKGLSLFAVPKLRMENGMWVENDVTTLGIFHKMGQKGVPAVHLSFGEKEDCHGHLIGQLGFGLYYMFQFMNLGRLNCGLMACGLASAGYLAALEYAQTRLQGRNPLDRDPLSPQVPIIEHADLRRMLLFQKSIVEGSISLALQCSLYKDLMKIAPEEERTKYYLLFELILPVVKSYPSEAGILALSAGIQCLGGLGYCEDAPLERYFRDIRINAIYEGTTGMHAKDLLGRKIWQGNTKAFQLFLQEIEQTIANARHHAELVRFAKDLAQYLIGLQEVVTKFRRTGVSGKVESFYADANLFLDMFGIIAIAWQWLMQATSAQKCLEEIQTEEKQNFYRGKIFTMRYFFDYEVPKTQVLKKQLLQKGVSVPLEMPSTAFK